MAEDGDYTISIVPVFVLDKPSCVRFIENAKNIGTAEFLNIQNLQVYSAILKADTGMKNLMIPDRVALDLIQDYKDSEFTYRVDAFLEATDHRPLLDDLSVAEELIKLASISEFESHLPTHIIVDDAKWQKELKRLDCKYDVILLSDTKTINSKFKTIKFHRK